MRIVRYSYPNYRPSAVASGAFSRLPWSGLEAEIGRLLQTSADDFAGSPASTTRFPVDLYEDKERIHVRAELPGLNREDINVEVVEGYLTIAASRRTPATEGLPEESFSFSRSVSIPDEVQTDQVNAAYENGVLTITLPKREEAKPKKISVAVK